MVQVEEEEAGGVAGVAVYLYFVFEMAVRRPVCPAFLSVAMADLTESQAMVFLTVLQGLWVSFTRGGKASWWRWPWRKALDEGKVLDWLMAVLDSNAVRLLLNTRTSRHHRLGKLLASMKGVAQRELGAWKKWESLGGCLDQLSKTDYRIESAAPYTQDYLLV